MISEKRKSRRFSGRIGIVSADADGLNFGFITDLSRDGAYLETGKLFSKETPFTFVLSNGVQQVPITTTVKRTRDAFFEGGVSGMGVQFINLDPLAKIVRDDLLLFLMNLHFQSMWKAA